MKSKWKDKQIRRSYGGSSGGGGAPAPTENIPAWMRPYLEKSLGAAQSAYDSGSLSQVAGETASQTAAFGMGNEIAAAGDQAKDTLDDQQVRLLLKAQSGGFDPTALKDAAITEAGMATAGLGQQYGQSGTLGSARQAVAQGAQNAQTSANFATLDRDAAQTNLQNKLTAEQGLGTSVGASSSLANSTASGLANLGSQERAVDQSKLDASWQGLQRLGSTIYGTPERQSTSQSGGGGK